MQSFEEHIEWWNSQIKFTRKLIKLKPGEKAQEHIYIVPPPDGWRDETDEEFAKRIKK